MTKADITGLFEKLARLSKATKARAGDGYSWDYKFPNGETHRYVIQGLNSEQEALDSGVAPIESPYNLPHSYNRQPVASSLSSFSLTIRPKVLPYFAKIHYCRFHSSRFKI